MSAPVDAVVMASAAPKERPILFSGPMVRAILAGRKTQTRRVLNLPRGLYWYDELGGEAEGWFTDGEGWWHVEELACRYGNPGDHLWVRETWAVGSIYDKTAPSKICEDLPKGPGRPPCGIRYPANQECIGIKCRPSIHMPRWASRITLEITGVRVERLNEISEEDALAEGVDTTCDDLGRYCPVIAFQNLWESINGSDSWAANPWVWVVEFKRLNEL